MVTVILAFLFIIGLSTAWYYRKQAQLASNQAQAYLQHYRIHHTALKLERAERDSFRLNSVVLLDTNQIQLTLDFYQTRRQLWITDGIVIDVPEMINMSDKALYAALEKAATDYLLELNSRKRL